MSFPHPHSRFAPEEKEVRFFYESAVMEKFFGGAAPESLCRNSGRAWRLPADHPGATLSGGWKKQVVRLSLGVEQNGSPKNPHGFVLETFNAPAFSAPLSRQRYGFHLKESLSLETGLRALHLFAALPRYWDSSVMDCWLEVLPMDESGRFAAVPRAHTEKLAWLMNGHDKLEAAKRQVFDTVPSSKEMDAALRRAVLKRAGYLLSPNPL